MNYGAQKWPWPSMILLIWSLNTNTNPLRILCPVPPYLLYIWQLCNDNFNQEYLWLVAGATHALVLERAVATLNILWYNILRNILEYFTGSGYIQYFDVRYSLLMLRMKWIIGVNQTKRNISGQHWGRRHKNLCRHWQWRPCKHTHFSPLKF